MYGTFRTRQKDRSHLDTGCSKDFGRRHLAAGRYSSCRYDGNIYGIDHLRNEHHCRQFADMAAAFAAFGDDPVRTLLNEPLCQRNGGNDGKHPDTCSFPPIHILSRVSGACRNELYTLVGNHLRDFVGSRVSRYGPSFQDDRPELVRGREPDRGNSNPKDSP